MEKPALIIPIEAGNKKSVDDTSKNMLVRPLNQFEEFLEQCHQKSIMISSYALTLNSKISLRKDTITRSLIHLFRKVPTLSLCIRPDSQGQLCFYRMSDETVDLEILPDGVYEEEFQSLTKHQYNTLKGPLWCAKLITLPSDHPCQLENVEETYPFSYILLFGFHHAITDGISNIRICNGFLNILNDVLGNEMIDDTEKLGVHYSSEFTEKIVGEIQENMMANPTEYNEIKELLLDDQYEAKFYEAFPAPLDCENETKNLYYSLSIQETNQFLKRCKAEGVSVHSGFCSVVNTAIVQMLIDSGQTDKEFLIKHYHTIDFRRYWDFDTKNTLGAHLGRFTMTSLMSSHDNIKRFWDRAREFQQTSSNSIEKKRCFQEIIILLSLRESFLDEDQRLSLRKDVPYYGTTNLGNLDHMFKGEGPYVQVTDLRRSTSTRNNLCSHVFHTFRGRFIYGLDYGTQLMTLDTAHLYVKTIFKILRRVIQE